MREAVIVSCARTAIGQFGQSLKDIPVVQLGGIAIKEAIKRAGIRPSKNKDKEFAPDIFGGKTDTDLEAKYYDFDPVSYTHLRAHETVLDLVCRLLLEKKKNKQ